MKIDCFIPYSGTDGVGTEADALDFDEYIRQGEPEAAENAGQWQTAIGLQAVDGLKPSRYLIETVLERLGEKANKLGKRLGKNRIAILRLARRIPQSVRWRWQNGLVSVLQLLTITSDRCVTCSSGTSGLQKVVIGKFWQMID